MVYLILLQPKWSKKKKKTYHENVICVWNLAPSSEELAEIIKLDRNIED